MPRRRRRARLSRVRARAKREQPVNSQISIARDKHCARLQAPKARERVYTCLYPEIRALASLLRQAGVRKSISTSGSSALAPDGKIIADRAMDR